MASAFASILAYGLMQMNGLAGLTGWRWIFIMQGLVSTVQTQQLLLHTDMQKDHLPGRHWWIFLTCRLS